jgi:hypothetical protein
VSDEAKSAVLTPAQLRKRGEEMAAAQAMKTRADMKKIEEHQKSVRDAFMGREPHPDALARIMTSASNLAEQGKSELLVLQFPASYLEDGGRSINNFEPDWPTSLTGFAKRAYEFYEANLKPHGYKVRARILDFPDGKLGDVGIFLAW